MEPKKIVNYETLESKTGERCQVDDGLQLLLDLGAALSHVPDSEVRRVCKVVMEEFQLEVLVDGGPPLLWLLLHLQIAN